MADRPGNQPFWGKCGACGHCWPIAWLPMEIEAAARLMTAARCPRCASSAIFPAKQDSGVLNEPNAEQFTSIASHGGSDVAGA